MLLAVGAVPVDRCGATRAGADLGRGLCLAASDGVVVRVGVRTGFRSVGNTGHAAKNCPFLDLPASATDDPGQLADDDGQAPPYESADTDRTLALAVPLATVVTAQHLSGAMVSLDGYRRRSAVGGGVRVVELLPMGGMAPVPKGGI